MLSLFVTLTLLALVDSLNPSTIVSGALLVTTQQPLACTVGFVLGVFGSNIAMGLLVYFGLGVLGPRSPFFAAFKLVLGLAFLGVAVWFSFRSMPAISKTLGRISPLLAVGIGMLTTFEDLPTAFAYLAALQNLVAAGISSLGAMTLLVWYNLIYVVPLLVLLGVYQDRLDGVKRRGIGGFLGRWARPLTLLFMYPLGVWFVLEGVSALGVRLRTGGFCWSSPSSQRSSVAPASKLPKALPRWFLR